MKKILIFLFSILLLTGTTLTLNSCNPDIPEVKDGQDGAPGTPGKDGEDGTDGLSIVIDIIDATEAQCPNGGTQFVFALDTNFNNQFDETDKVVNTVPICNGENGINCWDLNQNGQADPFEDLNGDGIIDVQDCTADNVIYNVTAIAKDAAQCNGAGGWNVAFGLDNNGNKQLDSEEVIETFTVCNGKDGKDGANGLDGIVAMGVVMSKITSNGCTTIGFYYDNGAVPGQVDEGDTPIDTMVVCDGSEGGTGQACWDLNGNGVGDTSEDLNGDGSVDVLDCRGSDGSDGSTGQTGATPLVTFTSTEFASNSQCPNGGVTIKIFVNNVEDTSFNVCNGTATQSYIVYSIFQDPTQCGDKGGVQVDVYEDVDGDGTVNPNVDFFFESFTICMGMNAAQVLAIGYGLDDYVDLDIQVVNGSDICPSDPNGSVITVYIENDFLISFSLCNRNYTPTFTVTGVTVSNITISAFTAAITTDVATKAKIEYGTVSGVYTNETTLTGTAATTNTITVSGLTTGTKYYWRIYVEDANGIGGYSSQRETTTN